MRLRLVCTACSFATVISFPAMACERHSHALGLRGTLDMVLDGGTVDSHVVAEELVQASSYRIDEHTQFVELTPITKGQFITGSITAPKLKKGPAQNHSKPSLPVRDIVTAGPHGIGFTVSSRQRFLLKFNRTSLQVGLSTKLPAQ